MTDRPHPSQWHVPWHSSLLVVQFQDRSFHEINCQSESKQQDEKFTNIYFSLLYMSTRRPTISRASHQNLQRPLSEIGYFSASSSNAVLSQDEKRFVQTSLIACNCISLRLLFNLC